MKKNLLGIILCPISIISIVGVGFSGWKLDGNSNSNFIETNLTVSEVIYDTDYFTLDTTQGIEGVMPFNYSTIGFSDNGGSFLSTTTFSIFMNVNDLSEYIGQNTTYRITTTLGIDNEPNINKLFSTDFYTNTQIVIGNSTFTSQIASRANPLENRMSITSTFANALRNAEKMKIVYNFKSGESSFTTDKEATVITFKKYIYPILRSGKRFKFTLTIEEN